MMPAERSATVHRDLPLRALTSPAGAGCRRLIASRFFRCRGAFPGQVLCLSEVACELFFSVRPPLPDGAQLMWGQILTAPLMAGKSRWPGSGAGPARFGVFAHIRIVRHDRPGQKTKTHNLRERART